MDNTKVLVGGPVSDHHAYCYDSFVKTVKSLTYVKKDIYFVDNSKDEEFYKNLKKDFPATDKIPYHPSVKVRLADSRNKVREKVLKEDFEYLFCLDQDVVAPAESIERLLRHGKKIVTGVYYNPFSKEDPVTGKAVERNFPVLWVKSRKNPEKLVSVRKDVLESGRLIQVDACGTGCILIHREVLEKIKFRWEEDKPGVDDVFFCMDALKEGYKIFADTSVVCGHLVEGRSIPWGQGDMKT